MYPYLSSLPFLDFPPPLASHTSLLPPRQGYRGDGLNFSSGDGRFLSVGTPDILISPWVSSVYRHKCRNGITASTRPPPSKSSMFIVHNLTFADSAKSRETSVDTVTGCGIRVLVEERFFSPSAYCADWGPPCQLSDGCQGKVERSVKLTTICI
jgi:hypothetical protein